MVVSLIYSVYQILHRFKFLLNGDLLAVDSHPSETCLIPPIPHSPVQISVTSFQCWKFLTGQCVNQDGFNFMAVHALTLNATLSQYVLSGSLLHDPSLLIYIVITTEVLQCMIFINSNPSDLGGMIENMMIHVDFSYFNDWPLDMIY